MAMKHNGRMLHLMVVIGTKIIFMVAEKVNPLDLQATHNCASNVDSTMTPFLEVSVLQEELTTPL